MWTAPLQPNDRTKPAIWGLGLYFCTFSVPLSAAVNRKKAEEKVGGRGQIEETETPAAPWARSNPIEKRIEQMELEMLFPG